MWGKWRLDLTPDSVCSAHKSSKDFWDRKTRHPMGASNSRVRIRAEPWINEYSRVTSLISHVDGLEEGKCGRKSLVYFVVSLLAKNLHLKIIRPSIHQTPQIRSIATNSNCVRYLKNTWHLSSRVETAVEHLLFDMVMSGFHPHNITPQSNALRPALLQFTQEERYTQWHEPDSMWEESF